MNKSRLAVAAALLSCSVVAQAMEFEDFGRVTRVTPQTERQNHPRQECRTEYVQVQQAQERGMGGSIIGGIAGAVLGSNIGSGNGRTAATAAGAIAGAIAGDRISNRGASNTTVEKPVRECHMVDNWETKTSGYEVAYDYRGRNYISVMSSDPGSRVRLRVSVEPADR